MRVLPVCWQWVAECKVAEYRAVTALPILPPNLITAGAAAYPTAVFKTASWESIRADAARLLPGDKRLDDVPLWSGECPLANAWNRLREKRPDDQSVLRKACERLYLEALWAVWRDWYQDAPDGAPPNWDKRPGHVPPMVERIVEKHRLRKEVRQLKVERAALRAGRASLDV